MSELADDERFMAAALALGRRGLGRTAPNPSVGALVVKQGIVLGRGWTGAGGRPHGETIALAQAGAASKGATIYVTLEPCSHHGQTPPCCEAIVAAGIARLVYAAADPNPLVAGRGAAYCRLHGLDVTGGVLAAQAERDHRGHILRMTRHRPMVTLKLAETLDGYVAGGPHDPRLAITGLAANGTVHGMRAMHDAIMVGIGTVLADDPLMTVRLPGVEARPVRVVIDSDLRITTTSRLLRTVAEAPVLVLTREGQSPRADLDAIEGLEIACCPIEGRRPRPYGGAGAAGGSWSYPHLQRGRPAYRLLADRRRPRRRGVLILTASRPLGGEGVPTLDSASRAALADAARFRLADDREIGGDRLRHYESLA